MAGPIAPCRLCGQVRELRDSHIVPAWCYERIRHGPEGRQDAPVLLDAATERAVYSTRQISEHLLCHACEEAFSVDEGYTSGILVQEDATFPWLEMVPGGAEERVVPAEDVDTMAISRFMYSI